MFHLVMRAAPWTLLALALAVRCGAAAAWEQRTGGKFHFGDSEGYWRLAGAIARFEPYACPTEWGTARIFRSPGYPIVLAPLFWIHDLKQWATGAQGFAQSTLNTAPLAKEPPILWARCWGAVMGTAAVGLVGQIAATLFDRRAGLVAMTFAAFSPGAIASSIFILSEAPFCPLMLAQLAAWIAATRHASTIQHDTTTVPAKTPCIGKRGVAWSFAAGILGGGATLVRPSWLLFTPLAAAIALILNWRTSSQARANAARGGLAAVLGMVLVLAPWWVRNEGVAGRFVPTTLQVGACLYDGWNPAANGGSDMRFVAEFAEEQRQADAAAIAAGEPLEGLFEDRLDARLKNASLAWAGANPGTVLQLAVVKVQRMWSWRPHAAEVQDSRIVWGIAATYVPVIALAIFGGIWFRRIWFSGRGWPFVLCLLPAAYLTLMHAVFVSSLRYREPPLLALMVLAAGAAVALWDALRSKRGAEVGNPMRS